MFSTHLKYAHYLLRHKWFVFVECSKRGLLFQGLLHDWSKFLPSQWIPYARHFYGGQRTETSETAFDLAWLSHQHHSPHHWQYWVLLADSGGQKVLPMPLRYRKEMLADWIGAGKAMGKPDTLAWYQANRHKVLLHPSTRAWIEAMLGARRD
jgi:hypothetical protein